MQEGILWRMTEASWWGWLGVLALFIQGWMPGRGGNGARERPEEQLVERQPATDTASPTPTVHLSCPVSPSCLANASSAFGCPTKT